MYQLHQQLNWEQHWVTELEEWAKSLLKTPMDPELLPQKQNEEIGYSTEPQIGDQLHEGREFLTWLESATVFSVIHERI